MTEGLTEYLRTHREDTYALLRYMANLAKPFLLRSDLQDALESIYTSAPAADVADTPLFATIQFAQEAAVDVPWIYLATRPGIGRWAYYRFHLESVEVEQIDVSDYLAFKERLVSGDAQPDEWPLEIDLEPFNRDFPKLRESRSIGYGVAFLNRRLSSDLFRDLDKGDRRLLNFLKMHQVQGTQLMLNDRITDVTSLRRAIRKAQEVLRRTPPDSGWEAVKDALPMLGFEPGWGNTTARMQETLGLLTDILEAPEPSTWSGSSVACR